VSPKKKPTDSPAESESLSFEQALESLESIVRELEEGQLGLSESLERYERGIAFLKRCHETLEQAERKISLLTGTDEAGNPQTEAFDDRETTLQQKQQNRGQRRSRPASKHPPSDESSPAAENEANIDNQRGLF
jgi:exodeoxyribonuclease VII small subunit